MVRRKVNKKQKVFDMEFDVMAPVKLFSPVWLVLKQCTDILHKILDRPKRFFERHLVKCTILITLLYLSRIIYNSIPEEDSECLVKMPFDSSKVFREMADCAICENVTTVDKIQNITPAVFDYYYARRTRPVVITDATVNWSARDHFSFEFFKELYSSDSVLEGELLNSHQDCQFFPYNTEFRTLRDALAMDPARSRLERDTSPWYIGWSNCNDAAGKRLRAHYGRPYFLPVTSENIALSWIFMGGPGNGAHMHVDNVRYPSWQAQLKGRKRWRLVPPPECAFRCQEIAAIVEPGEIIVVDTNVWYHQTFILPGSISITIGSEFD